MDISETLRRIRTDLAEGKYRRTRPRNIFDPVPEFGQPQVHDLPGSEVYVERYDGNQHE